MKLYDTFDGWGCGDGTINGNGYGDGDGTRYGDGDGCGWCWHDINNTDFPVES